MVSVDSFHQARNYYRGRTKAVRLIVLHDMETDEALTDAEAVGNYFAGVNAPRASAHVGVDADSTVGYVKDEDTAFGAAGANADGFHIEQSGRARQSREEWLDARSRPTIKRAALAGFEASERFGIPRVLLTVAEVADGVTKGFTDHRTVSTAFPNVSTGHTDPGAFYPWDVYLDDMAALAHPVPPINLEEYPMRFIAQFPDTSGYLVDTQSGFFLPLTAAGAQTLMAVGVPLVQVSSDVGSILPLMCQELRQH